MLTDFRSKAQHLEKAGAGCYRLSPSVILVPVEDGTARLLDMNGKFYAISASGTRMLQATLARGPQAAAEETAKEYGIDPQRAAADLDAFLLQLRKQRLITMASACKERNTRSIFDCMFLAVPLRFIHGCLRSRKVRASALLLWARISVHAVGWERTVAALRNCHGEKVGTVAQDTQREIVNTVNESLSQASPIQFFRMNCKERALCCWALIRSAGLPATLEVGISLVPLSAHCWCRLGPWFVGDDPDFCKQYLPVAHYA